MTPNAPLPRREILHALLLAAACSLLFLGAGVLPTRAVLPFVPERFEPLRSQALRDGAVDPAELALGNVTMGDKYNQSLAWDRILQDRLRSGEVPAWSRDIAGGVPFVPQQAQVYQPWNALLLLPLESAGSYGPWFFLHQVLFGLGAWWFLRRLGVGHGAACCGLVVAVLGLWTQARIHHNVILSAALPVFPLLTLVLGSFRERAGPFRIAGVAALLGIAWLGGFPPVALQVTLLTAAFALLCAFRHRTARPLLPLALGAALGGLIGAAQIVPTLVAASASSRTGWSLEEFAANGLSWQHLRSFVWPDLLHWPDLSIVGGEFRPAWTALDLLPGNKSLGFNFAETAFSVGLPGALLALLAFHRRADAATWFFGGIAVLAFGLSTATPPFLELSGVVPGARAGDLRRFLFLVSVCLVVLVGGGADRLRAPAGRLTAVILGALAVVVVAPLFVAQLDTIGDLEAFRSEWAVRLADGVPVGPETVLAEMSRFPLEAPANHAMLLWTSARVLILAIACALVSLLVVRPTWRILAWLVLLAMELLVGGHGTIVPVPVERVTRVPDVLTPVREASAPDAPRPRLIRLAPPDPARARFFLPPNLGAYWQVEDLGAYEPLPAARMEELFLALEPDEAGKPGVALRGAGVLALFRPESLRHPLLDLLGCRYVLAARDDLADPHRIDRTPASVPRPYRLYERTTAFPRATFCDRSELIVDRAARLARLGSASHDPRRTIVLEDPAAPTATGDGEPDADVEVLLHRDERVVLRVDAREPGYLRLADPWDPGWIATVDGRPATIHLADHYLRAVHVSPGSHVVEFRYDGVVVLAPRILAAVGLFLVAALVTLGILRRRAVPTGTRDGTKESG